MSKEAITNIISMLNGGSVGIFGMILSAAFCDVLWTRQKRWLMAGCMAGLTLFQGVVYIFLSPDMVRHLYPLITHSPLAVILCVINKKRLWPIISVFTAYLCCQLRRWLA